jgi:hypothetical protein
MSTHGIENVPTEPASEESLRLKAVFDELRKNQLTFLDEAGKRVIEISTGMLGVLFVVIAFGKDFPPPYLKDAVSAQLTKAALVLFFLALLAGFITVMPRKYKDYSYNLTAMEEQLQKAINFKVFWFRSGSVLFVLGAFSLAVLIIRIIQ